MDKGAHFRRCDFQVHTPRDIRWTGAEAITDNERKAYAKSLIRSCRDKGLGAIAVTDHHDMLFATYVRQAAQEEVDINGNDILPQHRITVFPGMELTVSVPCQALLLFDAELPSDIFSLIYNALAITPSEEAQSRTAQVQRLSMRTISEIKEALDRHDFLRGRYIILPNVSEGGSSTILRSGFAAEYKAMPCVGGYVDGSISQFGTGNSSILAGKNTDYGQKRIAVFQTSDNRKEDHSDLGKNTTWVKWAKPTAEALRQACLADQSRLSHDTPPVPQAYITSISVSNSKFLGPVNLEFNRQFNAIIGGRGTGKSSILEYVRWALCDEPLPGDDEEGIGYRAKRQKLIEKTLLSLDATVQVGFVKNDVGHILRRSATEGKTLLKIGDGEFEEISDAQIRSILPIQAYSQKQLSSVGVRVDQLRRFIEAPVLERLANISRSKDQLKQEIRQEYAKRGRFNLLNKNKEQLIKELTSQLQQAESLRKKLAGLSDADRTIINQKPIIDNESNVADFWNAELEGLSQSLESLIEEASNRPRKGRPANAVNSDEMDKLQTDLLEVYTKVRSGVEIINAELAAALNPDGDVQKKISGLAKKHSDFLEEYLKAKERSTAHQSTLQQLEEIENRIKVLQSEISRTEAELESLGDITAKFNELTDKWFSLMVEAAACLSEQCAALTVLSDGMIKATLNQNADFREVLQLLQRVVKGANIRFNKLEDLVESLATAPNVLEKWREVLAELEGIVPLSSDETVKEFPALPNLRVSLAEADLQKLSQRLTSQDWLELLLTPLESLPKFEYRAREREYISFEDASAGQQATALLWALLNQEGLPLLIDQPEDDLDSQIIIKIVEQLWRAKGRRQIIFSSHNANLVVNGDAELVVCCDYRTAGEQSSGHIKIEGAIDIPEVRGEITQVMEGGIEAFKLRKEKYGF